LSNVFIGIYCGFFSDFLRWLLIW